MSATLARPCLWKPSAKQEMFLNSGADEVLYGGGAGSGKTDSLAIDALGLQQEATNVPRYRAIIFRRSMPELVDLIDRTKSLYPAIIPGARFKEQSKQWHFPSGAKLLFGSIDADQDCRKYQGPEYSWVGFEELTSWPTSYAWDFMRSRLRGTKLKLYMRATCNPGGVGGKWVQERWQIPDDGSASAHTLTITVPGSLGEPDHVVRARLRFIPARLGDNPHISREYAAALMRLSPNMRRALLDGRWDVYDVPGAIYANELGVMRDEKRICSVPYDPAAPVYTAWDLGISDNTTIWFLQIIGREIHVIGYYSETGQGLGHFCSFIADKRDRLGWRFARHYLPHDVRARELMSGNKTREAFLREARIGPITVVERGDIEDGIHAVKQLLPRCWIDADACKAGVDSLGSYRRSYNSMQGQFISQPVHDFHSHCADSFRTLAMGLTAERISVPVKLKRSGGGGSWMGR